MTSNTDRLKIIWNYLLRISRVVFITLGVITFMLCILAFTSLPYWARYWLGTAQSEYHFKPDYIVMLGGSGMPSEENLMRLNYTALLAEKNSSSDIIIMHPLDSTVYIKMKKELTSKNIDSLRIFFQMYGTNTRSQALSLASYYPNTLNSKVVIVTSPEHVLRTLLVFRKIGFKNIGAYAAFESDMNIDLSYDVEKLGGRKYVPDVGKNINMRYNFWSYLKIEITCLREFTAITYYKLKGWI